MELDFSKNREEHKELESMEDDLLIEAIDDETFDLKNEIL